MGMDYQTMLQLLRQMQGQGGGQQYMQALQGYSPAAQQYNYGFGGWSPNPWGMQQGGIPPWMMSQFNPQPQGGSGQYNMYTGEQMGGGKATASMNPASQTAQAQSDTTAPAGSRSRSGYDVNTTQKLPRQGSGMNPAGMEWWNNTVNPALQDWYNAWGTPQQITASTNQFNPISAPNYNYSSPYGNLLNTLQGNYNNIPASAANFITQHGGQLPQGAPGSQIQYQNQFNPMSIGFNQSSLGQTQMGQASDYLNRTAGGAFLGMDNPELNRVQDAISSQYMDNAARLMSNAKQGFSQNFMGGSSNAVGRLGLMASDAAKDLGNTLATQRMGLYENERARQEAAAGQLGTLGQGMGQLGYQNALANLQAQVQAGQLSNEQAAQMMQGQIAQGQLQQGNLGMAADIMQNDIANQRYTVPLDYQYNQALMEMMMNNGQFNATQQQGAAGQNQAAYLQMMQLMQNPMAYFQQSWNYGDKNNLLAQVLGGGASILGSYMGMKAAGKE